MSSREYSRVEILAGSMNNDPEEHHHHNNHHQQHNSYSDHAYFSALNKVSLTTHPGFTNLCFDNAIDNEEICTPKLSSTKSLSARQDLSSSNDHCHNNSFDLNQAKQTKSAIIKLTSGFVICLVFMFVELIGGYLSHSLAIFSDAAHLTSDLVSFGISLGAILLAQKRPTQTQTFGHYRVEIIGVLVSIFSIWALTGVLVFCAVQRLVYQDFVLNSGMMLTVSSIGLVLNLLMMFAMSDGMAHCIQIFMAFCCFKHHENNDNFQQLSTNTGSTENSIEILSFDKNHEYSHENHNHSHSHSHGHTHGHHGHSHMNMNVRAAMLHIIGDILQSLGVLLAAIIVHFWPNLKLADPLCTLFFAAIVFATTRRIFLDTIHILMEGFPNDYQYEKIKNSLERDVNGVRHVHSLHVWSLTHGRNVLTVHLAVDPTYKSDKNFDVVRKNAQSLIRKEFGIAQSTIQVEYYEESVMQQCQTCSELQ